MTAIAVIAIFCAISGAARFYEGSNQAERPCKIDGLYLNTISAVCAGVVAFMVSGHAVPSLIVAGSAFAWIAYGGTKWESWKHQLLRGAGPGAILVFILAEAGHAPESPWLVIAAYTLAYVNYTAMCWFARTTVKTISIASADNHIWLVFNWEKPCRVIQGVCIAGAGAFI